MQKFKTNELVLTDDGKLGRYFGTLGNGEYSYVLVYLNEPDKNGSECELLIRKTETLELWLECCLNMESDDEE